MTGVQPPVGTDATYTSLFMVNTLFSRASGAVHLTGILPYTNSTTTYRLVGQCYHSTVECVSINIPLTHPGVLLVHLSPTDVTSQPKVSNLEHKALCYENIPSCQVTVYNLQTRRVVSSREYREATQSSNMAASLD